MRWVYRGREGGGRAREVARVARRTQTIDGAPCAVLLDRLYRNGHLAERTTDWYTQDARGWVHYFGEATAVLDRHGRVTSREGSWRAGRHGARGGVFMPAHPRVGRSFQQEHAPPTALDHFTIVSRRATIRVPYGTFRRRRAADEGDHPDRARRAGPQALRPAHRPGRGGDGQGRQRPAEAGRLPPPLIWGARLRLPVPVLVVGRLRVKAVRVSRRSLTRPVQEPHGPDAVASATSVRVRGAPLLPVDVHQVRDIDWAPRPLNDLEAPGGVIRRLVGTGMSFSRIRDDGGRLLTR